MLKKYTPFKFYKLKLYQQIMLLVFFLLLIVFSLNVFLVHRQMGDIVNHRLGNTADMVADSIATSPEITRYLSETPINEKAIGNTIKSMSQATKSSIVVFDNKENIVTIFNPTSEALIDHNRVGSDNLAALKKLPVNIFKSKNAKPIMNKNKAILGYVLVGFPESDGKDLSNFILNILIVASALGLTVGLMGALLLAYSVKKTLFGFEPIEISLLLEERTTLLNTVNESIFVTDPALNLRLLNTKAQEMVQKIGIDLPAFPQNEPFSKIGETTLLRKAIDSDANLKHISLNLNGLPTLGDISVLKHNEKITGLLVSLSEKDSVQAMAEQLSGVTNYADALRARTHEFMNKMHVIKGLLYTKDYNELQKYIENITEDDAAEMQSITAKINNPLLASFLIAKKSRSHELLVDFEISEESSFPEEIGNQLNIHDLIVIIGNLLENSFDVLKEKKDERSVLLDILPYEDELVIVVANNGKPISKTDVAKIFQKGYTTKGKGRGFGLALLQERLENLHGTISVDSDELNGTEFTVQISLKGE